MVRLSGPWLVKVIPNLNLPRQDSQHQVQDKERADDDERDEVEPVPVGAQGIVGLKHQNKV